MTAEKYNLASELFHRVRELPKSHRVSALDVACRGDGELRQQVLSLLEGDEEAGGDFLMRPAMEQAAELIAAADAPPLVIPEILAGRYRMGEQIGAGGMGVVYKAEDLRLPRFVAVKLLPVRAGAGWRERNLRFEREARAASQLNHPNIVAIYDSGTDAGLAFIVMEFVEGRTLRSLIQAGVLPDVKTVLKVISQMASALSAAHAAGIVHRDIKPENIMLRPDGFVKLLDFGLARMQDPAKPQRNATLLTRAGQVPGTVEYLSPEQALGQAVGPQTDVFSLGVVAYEFATGVRPFEGATDGLLFDAILHHDPKPPSAVRPALGDELDALILQTLEKDPELRLQSAAEIRSACKRLTRYSTPAKPVPVPQRSSPSSTAGKTRRTSWIFALAALLVFTPAATMIWMNRPLDPKVTRNFQITHGDPVSAFVNDGARIYYSTAKESNELMYEVSVRGGMPVPMPNFRGMVPLDISADRSEILLAERTGRGGWEPQPLWVGSVLGTPPRRLGDLAAVYAHWSSRGDKIAFTAGADLDIADASGSGARVLVHLNDGHATTPIFFDDDRRIRFTAVEKNARELWEIDADGTHRRQVLPSWTGGLQADSAMSADGAYSVFPVAQDALEWELWAFREPSGVFRFRNPDPVRLATGPLVATHPQFSPDGRRIFYIGSTGLEELVRYDPKAEAWLPYLGGIDALQLDFSRDGEWVTYVGPPGHSVWISRVDGRDATQLTAPPLNAVNPRWSPDGRSVVFWDGVPGRPNGIFLVPARGGAVIALTALGEKEASWSPDSQRVLYMEHENAPRLVTMNVQTRATEELPSSYGLRFPRWSPDGKYAAAADVQSWLWVYDMTTHERTLLTKSGAGYPMWSRDSQYVYFENSPCTVWYRVSIRDHVVEKVASLAGLRPPPSTLGWVGVTPDGSVISATDVSTRNVYAIDWDAR